MMTFGISTRQIPEDVADEVIPDAKALIFNKHIR